MQIPILLSELIYSSLNSSTLFWTHVTQPIFLPVDLLNSSTELQKAMDGGNFTFKVLRTSTQQDRLSSFMTQ